MQINGTIQEWLEGFGDPVADTAFPPRDKKGKPNKVSAPFNIFLDKSETDGSDDANFYTLHDLTIERYTQTSNTAEFERFLYRSGLHFIRSRTWLPSEQLFMTVYDITTEIITKNGVDEDVNNS